MKESNKIYEWLDRYWTVLVIILGVAFTLFLALLKPHNGWANYLREWPGRPPEHLNEAPDLIGL